MVNKGGGGKIEHPYEQETFKRTIDPGGGDPSETTLRHPQVIAEIPLLKMVSTLFGITAGQGLFAFSLRRWPESG